MTPSFSHFRFFSLITTLCLFTVLIYCAPVFADVTANLTPPNATVGDIVTLTIIVNSPDAVSVTLPDLEKRLAPLELRDQKIVQDQASGAWQSVIKLVSWEVGERKISGLMVLEKLKNGQEKSLRVPETSLMIGSVLAPGDQDIKDIRDPVPIQPPVQKKLLWILGILLLLALIALIVWLIVRYRRRRSAKSGALIYVPCHERALNELENLRNLTLDNQDRIKLFYINLSSILREYIEARFDIIATEQTTAMLAADLRDAPLNQRSREMLLDVLSRADLVKFAREPLDASIARGDIALAENSVRATAPVTTPGEEAPTAAVKS